MSQEWLVWRFCTIVLLALPLAACTTWVKPGAGPAALDAATTHCRAVAYATLPANMVTTTSRGASYDDRKKCEWYNSSGCIKSGDQYYAVNKTTTDTNSSGRSAIFRDCMYQDGWREQ